MKKENLIDIIDLIEDKDFPARRNISDCIICLLHDLGLDSKLVYDIEKTFDDEYENRGVQECLSQTEWKQKVKALELKNKLSRGKII